MQKAGACLIPKVRDNAVRYELYGNGVRDAMQGPRLELEELKTLEQMFTSDSLIDPGIYTIGKEDAVGLRAQGSARANGPSMLLSWTISPILECSRVEESSHARVKT